LLYRSVLLIIAFATGLLLFRQIKQQYHLVEFIDEFGRRAMDYVDVAIRDPEALDEYLQTRNPLLNR
jgi:hypothetical protein